MEERRNSIALAMELRIPSSYPSVYVPYSRKISYADVFVIRLYKHTMNWNLYYASSVCDTRA